MNQISKQINTGEKIMKDYTINKRIALLAFAIGILANASGALASSSVSYETRFSTDQMVPTNSYNSKEDLQPVDSQYRIVTTYEVSEISKLSFEQKSETYTYGTEGSNGHSTTYNVLAVYVNNVPVKITKKLENLITKQVVSRAETVSYMSLRGETIIQANKPITLPTILHFEPHYPTYEKTPVPPKDLILRLGEFFLIDYVGGSLSNRLNVNTRRTDLYAAAVENVTYDMNEKQIKGGSRVLFRKTPFSDSIGFFSKTPSVDDLATAFVTFNERPQFEPAFLNAKIVNSYIE